MECLFDTDPITRTVQVFHYDELTDTFTIEDRQNVDAIVEHNKAVQNDDQFRARPQNEVRRVASIPMNLFAQMQQEWREKGYSYEERQAALRRFLNDPNNKFFRTDDSRV